MINDKLDRLNNGNFDSALLDRTLEFGEALGELESKPGITTSSCTQQDCVMQGYQEWLQGNHEFNA